MIVLSANEKLKKITGALKILGGQYVNAYRRNHYRNNLNHFKDKKTAENIAELLTKVDIMNDQISNRSSIMKGSPGSINFIGNHAHETAICVGNDGNITESQKGIKEL